MAILTNMLSAISVNAPSGMWEFFLLKVFDFVRNYGWRVVLFTLCLKILLSPLDIYQRYKARKNQKITEQLKPQMEKLAKQYPDKTELSRKQMELNKKAGISYMSSCLPAILTLVIFITLLTGMNKISAYINYSDYAQLYDTYTASIQTTDEINKPYEVAAWALVDETDKQGPKEEAKKALWSALDKSAKATAEAQARTELGLADKEKLDSDEKASVDELARTLYQTALTGEELTSFNQAVEDEAMKFYFIGDKQLALDANADYLTDAEQIAIAQQAVYDYYQENKTSFLWVKNIWSPDVPWKDEIVDYDTFKTNIGDYKWRSVSGVSKDIHDDMMLKSTYNSVMGMLLDEDHNGSNGYLILPILSILLSLTTQFLSQRQQKKTGQMNAAMGGGSMKLMMWILPVMIGIFSLSYTAAFALYLVVQYSVSLLITSVSNFIVLMIDKKDNKIRTTTVQKYGRPDPNDQNK